MIRASTIAALLVLPSITLAASGGMWPVPLVYQSSAPAMVYDYCVREDGTATFANATDCTDAASSMSPVTFNASSFSAGDVVAISGRGGEITTGLVPPSSGTAGSEIVYAGEIGNLPTIGPASGACLLLGVSDIIISNMTLDGGSYGLHVNTGTYTGIETNGLTITAPSSEGARHEGTVDAIHNSMNISGVGEPITTHGGGTIVFNNAIVSDYDANGAVRGAPGSTANWKFYDSTFTATTGGLVISSTNISTGTYTFERNIITENGASRGWDIRGAGKLVFKNNIVTGTFTGDFYLLPSTGSEIYNNTFYDLAPSNSLIFNNSVTLSIKNNIFDTISGEVLYAATGTIDYNCFYSAGTVRGTNTVTSDPALGADGKLTASSTAVIGAGVGPSTDAVVPTDDIDGDTRSGATTDMGADQF